MGDDTKACPVPEKAMGVVLVAAFFFRELAIVQEWKSRMINEKDRGMVASFRRNRLFSCSMVPRISCGILLGGFLLMSLGCTGMRKWAGQGFKVGEDYRQPAAEVGPSWIDQEAYSGTEGSGNLEQWWTEFNDPVLTELIATLREQNLTLRAACYRILEAQAMRGVAAGNLFPQSQEFSGLYTRQELSETTPFGQVMNAIGEPTSQSNWNLGFNAAWEIDFWGRFRRAIEAADANLESSIYEFHSVLVLLEAEMGSNYILYRTLEKRLAIARNNLDLQEQTVDLVQMRFDAGAVSELDLRQAKAEAATTASTIPVLEAEVRKAQNRMCVLLGKPPQELAEYLGEREIPSPPPELAVGVPADLLCRRPDVRQVERQLAAQCAKIGMAESELYPHIAITGTIGLEAQEFNDLFGWPSVAGSIGPGFRWNVLNYGRILNNVRAEDARFRQLLAHYRETVLKANEEAENSLNQYLKEQARAKLTRQSVEELKRATELALLLYQEGMTDYQRVLDTQRALLRQQDLHIESRGNVSLYLVGVYKALGGGWESGFASTMSVPAANMTTTEAVVPSGENRPEIAPPRPTVPDFQQPEHAEGPKEGQSSADGDAPGFATTGKKGPNPASSPSLNGGQEESKPFPMISPPNLLPGNSRNSEVPPPLGYLLPPADEEGGKVVIVSANKPTQTIYR